MCGKSTYMTAAESATAAATKSTTVGAAKSAAVTTAEAAAMAAASATLCPERNREEKQERRYGNQATHMSTV